MLIGYARVSTDDQLLDLQRDALTKVGCERLFEVSVRATPSCNSNLNPFKPLVHALALKCRWIKNISIPFNHRVMLWMIGVGHRF